MHDVAMSQTEPLCTEMSQARLVVNAMHRELCFLMLPRRLLYQCQSLDGDVVHQLVFQSPGGDIVSTYLYFSNYLTSVIICRCCISVIR